jgi:hypothetical protein
MITNIKKKILDYKNKRDWHWYANNVNLILNKVKVQNQPTQNQDVIVFYHLFLLNQWQSVFREYIKALEHSGLYIRLQEFCLCVIYKEEADIEQLKSILKKHPKIKLYYKRRFDDLPACLWKNPKVEVDINLGEGESVIKMVEHAQNNPKNSVYLFLHAKGVTNPKNKQRLQTSYFYKQGLSKKASNQEISDFINKTIIDKTITNWDKHLKRLESKHFYYFVWNIFWVRSDLLKKFDFNTFNKQAQFPMYYGLTNRHWSAIFPLNLYGVAFKKKIIMLRSIIDLYL